MIPATIVMHANRKRFALFPFSFQGEGAERVMITLASELARREFLVGLITAAAAGPYSSAVALVVTIHEPGASRVAKSLFPLSN
jgi:hypothetical protein